MGARGPGAPSFNMVPVADVLKRAANEMGLLNTAKMALNCLDSSSLMQVTLVTAKNLPGTIFHDNSVLQLFENPISMRMRYVESGLQSVASVVYNLACSLVFTLASVITFGQVDILTDQAKKHWVHTALAVASVGISVIGAVSPEYGRKANLAVLMAVGVGLAQLTKANALSNLGSTYQRYSQELKAALLQSVGGNQVTYQEAFAPIFAVLDNRLNANVQTLVDLVEVVGAVDDAVPRLRPALMRMMLEEIQGSFGFEG